MGNRGKVAEQGRARELRAQAWTMSDIAKELGVSKGSVSKWTHDIPCPPKDRAWSTNPARFRGANALQRRKAAEIEELLAEGGRRIGVLSERDLLIAGTMLYAGEGSKTDGAVKLANTNPSMIALHCRWLRHFFAVDESRLRAVIYLHQGLDLEAATTHWAEITAIPGTQFTKPYRAVADGSIRRSKHPMGCLTVAYSCTRTHRAVMGLIDALLQSPVDLPG